MKHQQRKNIIRACKKQDGWYDGEGAQDKLIAAECEKRGFEFSDFYNEEGSILEKLLK